MPWIRLDDLCPRCRDKFKGDRRGPKPKDRAPIIAGLLAGEKLADIAARLGIGLRTVEKVKAEWKRQMTY